MIDDGHSAKCPIAISERNSSGTYGLAGRDDPRRHGCQRPPVEGMGLGPGRGPAPSTETVRSAATANSNRYAPIHLTATCMISFSASASNTAAHRRTDRSWALSWAGKV